MKRPNYVCQYWRTLLDSYPNAPKPLIELIEFWSVRSCGLACASSAIEFLTGERLSIQSLFNETVSSGGYSPAGWRHDQLAQTIEKHGIKAIVSKMTIESIKNHLLNRKLVIASVTHKFPIDGRKGGHLILLYKIRKISQVDYFCFMDPSGWGEFNHIVPVEIFSHSFSFKGIVLSTKDI